MKEFFYKLIDNAPALALLNLVVSLAVYLSGYIIVNAYLSEYYIRQTQILHTSYISAGVLFIFINLIAALFALPISNLFSWLFKNGEELMVKNSEDSTKRVFLWIVIPLAGLIIMIFVVWVTGVSAGFTTSYFLGLSSRSDTAELSSKIINHLLQMYWLLISVYLLVGGVIVFQGRLTKAAGTLTILISLSVITFGFMQYYSLLIFAGRIYAELPVTIGGGQSQHVRIFMEKENAERYNDLFKAYGFEMFPNLNNVGKITASSELELIWQVGPNKPSEETFTGYAVYPLSCGKCPVIVITASDIVSVGYFP
jgi:flagellar basal body-associated protein FliL